MSHIPEVARKLFRFLHDEGVRYCVIADDCARGDEVHIAVDKTALSGLSGRLTRFAHCEDLMLVRFNRNWEGCEATLAWLAEGDAHYLRISVSSDLYVSGVRVWRAHELLAESLAALDASGKPQGYFVPSPAAEFLYYFLSCVTDGELSSRMERASLRFSEDPAGAKARLKHYFDSTQVAEIVQALESKQWETLSERLPRLRARLKARGFIRQALIALCRGLVSRRGLLVACIGPQGSGRAAVIERIVASLAPAFAAYPAPLRIESTVDTVALNFPRRALRAGKAVADFIRDRAALLAMKFRTRFLGQTIVSARVFERIAHGDAAAGMTQPDLWIVLDAPPEDLQGQKEAIPHSVSMRERDECLSFATGLHNAVVLDAGRPLERVASEATHAILGLASLYTASRSRFSGAQPNRFGARLLLFCCRHRVPIASSFVRTLFNSEIDCPLRFPIHLPYPFGIVIHAKAEIGAGVTVMQQVTIGVKSLDDTAAPLIEDDVFIGAGAKVLGAVTVGRGAVIGANAVITRSVPKLATVAGVNHVIHAPTAPPGDETIRLIEGLKAAEGLDLQLTPPELRKANDV